jgi:hypothetical protein
MAVAMVMVTVVLITPWVVVVGVIVTPRLVVMVVMAVTAGWA